MELCGRCTQDNWRVVVDTVLDKTRMKRLRHILRADKVDLSLASKLVEFVLHEKPVDIEKLRHCLRIQVGFCSAIFISLFLI